MSVENAIAGLRRRTSEKWATYPDDILPAFVAEMDFPLADPIRAALHEAIERSDTGYAYPAPLRSAFADYARGMFGWDVAPERVYITPDVMCAVTETLRLLTKRGDGVVINPPVYHPYFKVIADSERRVVEVPLTYDEDGRYDLDWAGLEQAFRDGAKAFLLCHPHNPVGHRFGRDDLERIADLAGRYGVLVLSDEIFSPITFGGEPHVPFVEVSQVDAITIMSASKGWNIPGLKCAQAVAGSERVRHALDGLPQDITDRVGHLGVIGTLAAYRDGNPWLRELVAQLDENRKLLRDLLARQIPAIRYRLPDATYLAWLDCTALNLGDDPARVFRERGRIALVDGSVFGSSGQGFVRFNFGTPPEVLTEAVRRMASALK